MRTGGIPNQSPPCPLFTRSLGSRPVRPSGCLRRSYPGRTTSIEETRMHQHGHNDPNAAKLYELIKDVKIAMMTTVDTDGTLHSRPMHSQDADGAWRPLVLHPDPVSQDDGDLPRQRGQPRLQRSEDSDLCRQWGEMRDKAKIEEKWSRPLRLAKARTILQTAGSSASPRRASIGTARPRLWCISTATRRPS